MSGPERMLGAVRTLENYLQDSRAVRVADAFPEMSGKRMSRGMRPKLQAGAWSGKAQAIVFVRSLAKACSGKPRRTVRARLDRGTSALL